MIAVTGNTNIWHNLALETVLLENLGGEPLLFLWSNSPCIVIGRFQNPWVECNLRAMEADGVLLSRRFSGGGAVYHDLGNTCFTLAVPRSMWDKEQSFSIPVGALASLGIKASLSGRNDILVGGRKVSGSAFRLTGEYACHHATMLINEDLSALSRYLTPDKEKLAAKGIRSVSSRVANLNGFVPSVTREDFCSSIISAFNAFYKREDIPIDADSVFSDNPRFTELRSLLESDGWRLGMTPKFSDEVTFRCSSGMFTFHLDVTEGIIRNVKVFSDTLDESLVADLEQQLTGCSYSSDAISSLAHGNSDSVSIPLSVLALRI